MKHESVLTEAEIVQCYDDDASFQQNARTVEQAILTKLAEKAQPVAFNGWYCAHCQRGVDAGEVTCNEQHEACGRVISDDVPPPTPSALLEAAESVIDWIAGDYKEGSPEANALGNLIAAIEAHKKGQA